jgi:hypothetical protein
MTGYLRALTEFFLDHSAIYLLITLQYGFVTIFSNSREITQCSGRSCDSEKRFLLVFRRRYAVSHVVKV